MAVWAGCRCHRLPFFFFFLLLCLLLDLLLFPCLLLLYPYRCRRRPKLCLILPYLLLMSLSLT